MKINPIPTTSFLAVLILSFSHLFAEVNQVSPVQASTNSSENTTENGVHCPTVRFSLVKPLFTYDGSVDQSFGKSTEPVEVSFKIPEPHEEKYVPTVRDDDDIFLFAIEEIEGARNGEIGSRGERSSFQFLRLVWKRYSRMPFSTASSLDPESLKEQRRVARAHLNWIKDNISNPTILRVAMAWNAGIGAVNRHSVPRESRNYATRVVAVYESMKKNYVTNEPTRINHGS